MLSSWRAPVFAMRRMMVRTSDGATDASLDYSAWHSSSRTDRDSHEDLRRRIKSVLGLRTYLPAGIDAGRVR